MPRTTAPFLDGWAFALTDDPAAASPDFDASAFAPVRLPHDWSVEHPFDSALEGCTGYLPGGFGTYRKALRHPRHAGRRPGAADLRRRLQPQRGLAQRHADPRAPVRVQPVHGRSDRRAEGGWQREPDRGAGGPHPLRRQPVVHRFGDLPGRHPPGGGTAFRRHGRDLRHHSDHRGRSRGGPRADGDRARLRGRGRLRAAPARAGREWGGGRLHAGGLQVGGGRHAGGGADARRSGPASLVPGGADPVHAADRGRAGGQGGRRGRDNLRLPHAGAHRGPRVLPEQRSRADPRRVSPPRRRLRRCRRARRGVGAAAADAEGRRLQRDPHGPQPALRGLPRPLRPDRLPRAGRVLRRVGVPQGQAAQLPRAVGRRHHPRLLRALPHPRRGRPEGGDAARPQPPVRVPVEHRQRDRVGLPGLRRGDRLLPLVGRAITSGASRRTTARRSGRRSRTPVPTPAARRRSGSPNGPASWTRRDQFSPTASSPRPASRPRMATRST